MATPREHAHLQWHAAAAVHAALLGAHFRGRGHTSELERRTIERVAHRLLEPIGASAYDAPTYTAAEAASVYDHAWALARGAAWRWAATSTGTPVSGTVSRSPCESSTRCTAHWDRHRAHRCLFFVQCLRVPRPRG